MTDSNGTVVSRTPRLLIVGGSTRAAARSARRAGYHPVCADLFADCDLHEIAEIVPVRQYPDSLPQDVTGLSTDGWIFTGALENRPDLISHLQANNCLGPLLGTSLGLETLRDPWQVVACLRQAGIPSLDILPETAPPRPNGAWIRKPRNSAGGRAIAIWDEEAAAHPLCEPHFFQRRAVGQPLSALFHAGTGGTTLLGMTQPLIEPELCPPEPFSYAGSLAPADVPADVAGRVLELGQCLTTRGLRGVFGLDLVVCDAGIPWLLEVNPRYPASLELLELVQGCSLLTGPRRSTAAQPANAFVAKGIVYASRPMRAVDLRPLAGQTTDWSVPRLTDIPWPGTEIPAGWPICTVFASAASAAMCRAELRAQISTVRRILETPSDAKASELPALDSESGPSESERPVVRS